MGDEVNKELKYTQEDMDNITSKVKESTMAKFEKNYVSKETYDELLSKYNAIQGEKQMNSFKEVFLSKGGVENAYDDFYKLEQENITNLKEKDYDQYFENISKQKNWAFKSATPNGAMFNDQKIMNDLMGENIDLVEGTIYYKNQNKYKK